MKIAFCGASSTGKTTLAKRLMATPEFRALVPRFLTTNARAMLKERGHQSMDLMDVNERRSFQAAYLKKKLTSESHVASFLTDRSFVDVAAYSKARDSPGLPGVELGPTLERCREAVRAYDMHFYFPLDVIDFESDGYRSEDRGQHRAVADCIESLLDEWNVGAHRLDMPDLAERTAFVLEKVREYGDEQA